MKELKGKEFPARHTSREQGWLEPLPKSLTYAAVVDVRNGVRNEEQEITEFMVRRACDEMDKVQQFPFAPR